MSLALASRKAALLVPWNRNELWRNARAVPSLDLRFAESKSLADAVTGQNLVTFTRASSGTYVDSQGVIRTATNDMPRFEHNPLIGESLGLLVEEARTNSIRNNTMVGAVAGTPGTNPTNWFVYVGTGTGVSTSIVGTGTENGVTYVDIRFNGTPSASTTWSVINEPGNVIAAASGQSWTYSTWARISAGSNANITSPVIFFDENQGSNYVTGGSIVASYLTSTWQRYSATRTLSGGATIDRVNAGLRFSVTAGQAIDITLRIGLPQLEQGGFATTAILTSGTAATRSADVASISGSNFSSWYNQTEGSFYAEAASSSALSTTKFIFNANLDDGNRIDSRFAAGTPPQGYRATVRASSTSTFDQTSSAQFATGVFAKGIIAYRADDSNFAVNGVIGTQDTSVTIPTGLTNIKIGRSATDVDYLGGTIRRLTYFPQRLPNSTLQQITA